MNSSTFLTWLENAAVRFLISSPRIGLIAIKEHNSPCMYIARDTSDMFPVDLRVDAVVEPISMQLERTFNAPSHGERE
jgi:hypothetical protein